MRLARARRHRAATALALVLAVWMTALGEVPSRQSRRDVFVTVLAPDGTPVSGLTAESFVVFVDRVPQEILAAAPAAVPLSTALLTDQLGSERTFTAPDIRQALASFVAKVRTGSAGSSFALATFDSSVRPVTRFTSSPVILDRALERLNGVGEDAYFLDALADMSRRAREFPTRRRAVLAVLGTYRPERSGTRTDELGDLLRDSGASLWAIEALDRDRGAYPHAPRELVLETATVRSGGLREIVSTPQQLDAAIDRVASGVLAQYHITYGPGTRTAGGELTVGVRRPNVQVLAPTWMPR